MKLEDIQISFGKSVLFEKSQHPDFLKLVDSLCKNVPGSFLHCTISGTGWVTIIRYSKLKTDINENYVLVRIVMLKKYADHIELSPADLRGILYERSHKQLPYFALAGGVNIADSCPIICHKESVSILIDETVKNIRLVEGYDLNILTYKLISTKASDISCAPHVLCDRFSDCASLYGEDGASDMKLLRLISPDISKDSFRNLEKDVNMWKIKLKRKGRRALKKNLTLKPI